jgi:hypothetical protein
MICKECFSHCKSLVSVTFECDSKLQRIEESAFKWNGLTELLLPNSLQFLSGSAIDVRSLYTISFWPGPCEFQVHEMLIEDMAGRSVIRYFGRSSAIVIESKINILCAFCFRSCESLLSVTFECDSTLQRIEECAFALSGLTTIHIPSSVEMLCKRCFWYCESLVSVTFEPDSKLREVAGDSFKWSPRLHRIEYPPWLAE